MSENADAEQQTNQRNNTMSARQCTEHEAVNEIDLISLIDGVAMNRRFPDTFILPSDKDKESLHEGSYVMVSVRFGCRGASLSGERFWVTVTKVNEETVSGVIDNELACEEDHGMNMGDRITFTRDHVLAIMEGVE